VCVAVAVDVSLLVTKHETVAGRHYPDRGTLVMREIGAGVGGIVSGSNRRAVVPTPPPRIWNFARESPCVTWLTDYKQSYCCFALS
jgi:hypothetical protein